MDDLVTDFVCEAAGSLDGLRAGLGRLADDHADSTAAADMARRLHGLKGLCGFVGFARAEALVHAGEDLLAVMAATSASPSLVAPLGAMLERLEDLFTEAALHGCEPSGDDDGLLGLIGELTAAGAAVPRRSSPTLTGSPDRRVRAPWSGLNTLAQALGDRLGKRIELMVGGDDLRIAPEAAPMLRTALIALVRNACDHGVETPSERREAAKPGRALIRLSVHRTPEGATIEIADDGRGIDPGRLRLCGLETGRLSPGQAESLTDEEAQALVFAPGLSTASTVTALSGRGLGLDLVRREIEALGGRIELRSAPGQGARFLIALPASVLATPAARSRAAA